MTSTLGSMDLKTKKVFFLTHKVAQFRHYPYLEKYLANVRINVGEDLPSDVDQYDLVVLLGCRRIIKGLEGKTNILILHSSDLPRGRGWAPIYHALAGGERSFVVSGILPGQKVDEGNIVVQARFPISPSCTAEFLRKFDEEISILLVQKVLERFQGRPLRGKPQEGESPFCPRRRPENNEVLPDRTLFELLPHLRACEKDHPAYLVFGGVKFFLHLEPAAPPSFPSDIEIVFYDPPVSGQ